MIKDQRRVKRWNQIVMHHHQSPWCGLAYDIQEIKKKKAVEMSESYVINMARKGRAAIIFIVSCFKWVHGKKSKASSNEGT